MKKIIMAVIAVAVLFLGSQIVLADEGSGRDWDKTDAFLLGTSVTLLGVDWSQTRYIASHPHQYYEKNSYLGAHPSIGKVNRYFVADIAGTVGVAVILPSKWRKFWLGGSSIIEFNAVRHNRSIGIKTDF